MLPFRLQLLVLKKRNKGLAVLSLLMIIGAYGMAEMSKKQKSSAAPTEVTHSAVMSGQEVYTSNCAKCHGDDGKAGVMGAKDLSQSALDINATIEIIKNGKGAMTPFEGMLSEKKSIPLQHMLKR